MNARELQKIIDDSINDVVFHYKGMNCGIFPSAVNGKCHYDVWCDDKKKEYFSDDEVMNDSFWNGERLADFCRSIEPEYH